MNRTNKDATVKRCHCDGHDQLRTHLADFLAAHNFARRLKTLNGLTPYEYICKIWTAEPDRFILDPIHHMPGLNMPGRVVIDKSGASFASLQAMNVILKFTCNGRTIEVRQVKYLNNILEQDHRSIKRITGPMMGFKAFRSAAAAIAGIEVAHMIQKGQIPANAASAFQVFAGLAA